MMNWISNAIAHLNAFIKKIQVKSFLSVVLVGFLVFANHPNNVELPANNIQSGKSTNKAAAERIKDIAHQNDSARPKTTGEFLEEARGDVPLNERLDNITRDSVEAFKDWGSEYVDMGKESANHLKNKTEEATKGTMIR